MTEVIFTDGSLWSAPEGAVWEPLKAQKPRQPFADGYAEKVYAGRFGSATGYVPRTDRDLWYCGCGALNRAEEKTCHACGHELAAFAVEKEELAREGRYAEAQQKLVYWDKTLVQQAFDLFVELDDYRDAPAKAKEAAEKLVGIEQKEQEAAREKARARKKAEARAARAKLKRRILVAIVLVLLALGALYYFVIREPFRYDRATMLMESDRFEEAKETFTALGTYKDSAEMITECDYRAAKKLFIDGAYEEAEAAFLALGAYKDSAVHVQNCREAINNRDHG